MFAKNQNVQEKLQRHWNEAITERKYVAVVEGKPKQEEGTLKSYISENTALVVHKASAEEGKLAITHYRVLKSNQQFSLLELELETGRKTRSGYTCRKPDVPLAETKNTEPVIIR